MEKAKLAITKTKKGNIVADIVFPNNKKMTVPGFSPPNAEVLNGKEVDVARDKKGQIMKIVMEGVVVFSRGERGEKKPIAAAAAPGSSHTLEIVHSSHIADPARAPYNFVPLNEKVVPAEKPPPLIAITRIVLQVT